MGSSLRKTAQGKPAQKKPLWKPTPERVAILTRVLTENGTQALAEIEAGMGQGTLTHVLQRGEAHIEQGIESWEAKLSQAAKHAREKMKQALVSMVLNAAANGTEQVITEARKTKAGETVTLVRKIVEYHPDLALEVLARRFPDEWGRKDKSEIRIDVELEARLTEVRAMINALQMDPVIVDYLERVVTPRIAPELVERHKVNGTGNGRRLPEGGTGG